MGTPGEGPPVVGDTENLSEFHLLTRDTESPKKNTPAEENAEEILPCSRRHKGSENLFFVYGGYREHPTPSLGVC